MRHPFRLLRPAYDCNVRRVAHGVRCESRTQKQSAENVSDAHVCRPFLEFTFSQPLQTQTPFNFIPNELQTYRYSRDHSSYCLMLPSAGQPPQANDMRAQAGQVLRRITRWACEGSASEPKYRTNYKGIRGRIGIVGGARDYAGAPYFAAISTMRLGADLAYVICSQSASQAIKAYSPDLIVCPMLDQPDQSGFDKEMDCLLGRLHAMVVGPGLGREEHLQKRAQNLIERAVGRLLPLVLDADSLLLITENPNSIRDYSKALLTPNRIELQRLLNEFLKPSEPYDLRTMQLQQIEPLIGDLARKIGVTILAKGMVDTIYAPNGLKLATEAHTGSNRRCGGQGDILAGLSGVFMHWIEQFNKDRAGQLDPISDASAWAAYLAALTTRKCNELAFAEYRQGTLASNMIDKIQLALEALLSESAGNQFKLPSITHQSVVVSNQSRENQRTGKFQYAGSLSQDEIKRYARHMIMEEFGPERQMKLKRASALIIGAGGLGCPAAIYLAAAGMGRLGIVDDDRVEESNLHRQILHTLARVGWLKTDSIKEAVLAVNPNVLVETHPIRMDRHNAVKLVEQYDIILDCTDNLLTRYMISDACVVARRPLVSAAALKMNGQLTVYNYGKDTPCFRCLFPQPPPPNAVGSCSDNGVLGVIPGIMGVQQALEAIKLGAGLEPAYAGRLLTYDGQLGLFRHLKLDARKADCEACGPTAKLSPTDLIDYNQFCPPVCRRPSAGASNGQSSAAASMDPQRVTVQEYRRLLEEEKVAHVLVDVRPMSHSNVSRLAHALQLPVSKLAHQPEECLTEIRRQLRASNGNQIYVVCRRGIASQKGAQIIRQLLSQAPDEAGVPSEVAVRDIIGGMSAWAAEIDPSYSCV